MRETKQELKVELRDHDSPDSEVDFASMVEALIAQPCDDLDAVEARVNKLWELHRSADCGHRSGLCAQRIASTLEGCGLKLWSGRRWRIALTALKRAKEANSGRLTLVTEQPVKVWTLGVLASSVWLLFSTVKTVKNFARALNEYSFNHFFTRIPFYSIRTLTARYLLGIRIGKGVALHLGLFVSGRNITVGACSVLNRGIYLDGRGAIQIGENCSIGPHTYILTVTHDPQSKSFASITKQTSIGDRVWIGARAMIMPGVTIGEGAVIGAGSIVTRDVDPFTIVVGNPARVIKQRCVDLKYQLGYFPFFDSDITAES